YALYTFVWNPAGIITLHYIHFMVFVLASSVIAALVFNRLALSRRAEYIGLAALRSETRTP
ncbi:MAG: SLC5 family protein, partial [Gammaproteobacteria bacterium]